MEVAILKLDKSFGVVIANYNCITAISNIVKDESKIIQLHCEKGSCNSFYKNLTIKCFLVMRYKIIFTMLPLECLESSGFTPVLRSVLSYIGTNNLKQGKYLYKLLDNVKVFSEIVKGYLLTYH